MVLHNLYAKLPEELQEVDVIVAGGQSLFRFSTSFPMAHVLQVVLLDVW